MAMRTLIVDDEAPARERLKRHLANLEGVEVIGEAKDGVQAVEMIEAQSPERRWPRSETSPRGLARCWRVWQLRDAT